MYWGYYICYYKNTNGKCKWIHISSLTHLHLRSIKNIRELYDYIQRPYIHIHLYANLIKLSCAAMRLCVPNTILLMQHVHTEFNWLKKAQTTTHNTNKGFRKSICSRQFRTWKMRTRLPTWCWMISASQAWNGDSWSFATHGCESGRVAYGCPLSPGNKIKNELYIRHKKPEKGWGLQPPGRALEALWTLNRSKGCVYDCQGGRVWVRQLIYFNPSITIPSNQKNRSVAWTIGV